MGMRIICKRWCESGSFLLIIQHHFSNYTDTQLSISVTLLDRYAIARKQAVQISAREHLKGIFNNYPQSINNIVFFGFISSTH